METTAKYNNACAIVTAMELAIEIHKEESITMIMNQKSCDRNEAIITIEEGKNGNNDFYS